MRKQTKTIGVVSPTRRECRARTNKRETVWKWRHTRIVMKYRSIGWNKRGRATADDEQDVYILHCAFYFFETSPEGVAKSCGPPQSSSFYFSLLPGNGRRREEAGRGLCDRFFKLVWFFIPLSLSLFLSGVSSKDALHGWFTSTFEPSRASRRSLKSWLKPPVSAHLLVLCIFIIADERASLT